MNATKSNSKKQVRETNVGKSISAYVILKDGQHIATVQAAFLDSGNVMVDVWDKHTLVWQGRAGGYGYDKFVAALSGAKINGIEIHNHCGTNDNGELEKIMRRYEMGWELKKAQEEAKKLGASFVNWNSDKGKYTSLYYQSGLDRLREMGYTIIQAI